jgi:tRNA nucleotidyltransferase (CCA-adding enzyme)
LVVVGSEVLVGGNAVNRSDERERTDRGWRHFPHAADIGVEGWGPTLEAAFEQAAFALTAAITSAAINESTVVDIACSAPDRELLFVEWLNANIYEMAVRRMLFGRFEVHLDANELVGRLWGEVVDYARHEPACEPKGATYTELSVRQDEQGTWTARCVVDV